MFNWETLQQLSCQDVAGWVVSWSVWLAEALPALSLLCILGHLPPVHPWLPGGIARATDITLRTACLPHHACVCVCVCVAWCRGVPRWLVPRLCGGVLWDVLATGKGMESSSCGGGRWMFRFIAAGTCCVLRPCVRRRMLAIISGCFGLPRPVFCGMLVELLEYLWEGLRLIKFSVCLRAFVCVCVCVSVSVCIFCIVMLEPLSPYELAFSFFLYTFLLLITFPSRCTLCVILCLFGALSHRVGALQMSIIIIIVLFQTSIIPCLYDWMLQLILPLRKLMDPAQRTLFQTLLLNTLCRSICLDVTCQHALCEIFKDQTMRQAYCCSWIAWVSSIYTECFICWFFWWPLKGTCSRLKTLLAFFLLPISMIFFSLHDY